jgi:hypothetical protein
VQSTTRAFLSVLIGSAAALVCYAQIKATPGHLPDFGLSWFGARSLVRGQNPYDLVGRGLAFDWPWPLVYPATSFAAVIPLSFFPQIEATLVFVFLSFCLLAYSIDRYRLPMFLSMPVVIAAAAGQWSPLLAAGVGLPWVASLFACKPTEGLALLTLGSRETLKFAAAGALFLGVVSLILFPSWPIVWLGQLKHARVQMAPPLLRPWGFLILLAALRWKDARARFILALSVIPAVGAWYTAVPLFLVPNNWKQVMTLSMTSSLGWLLQASVVNAASETQLNTQVGSLIVLSCFLPSVLMVLIPINRKPGPVGT